MTPKTFLTLASAMTLTALAGCNTRQSASAAMADQANDSLTPAMELRQRLLKVQADSLTIFGHDDDPVYGVNWNLDQGRSDVLETAGDYPGIMHWDLGLIEVGSPVNLDSVPFDRMAREMVAHHQRGGINAISWHPLNPQSGKDAWQPVGEIDVVTLAVTDGTAENDTLRSWLARAAAFMDSLRDSDGKRIPLIFRPWHEMSGDWFWWAGPNTTAASYTKLWEITREALDAAGLDNILYAYSPDVVASEEEYLRWYPGDRYVDILGADVYHRNGTEGTETWFRAVDSTYGAAVKAARAKGKIAALTETGCEGLAVTDWYTSCLLPVIRRHHPVYVTVWRNARDSRNHGHFFAPYPGHPSVDSFKAFHADSLTVFARELKNMN